MKTYRKNQRERERERERDKRISDPADAPLAMIHPAIRAALKDWMEKQALARSESVIFQPVNPYHAS